MGKLKQHIALTVGNMMEYLPKGIMIDPKWSVGSKVQRKSLDQSQCEHGMFQQKTPHNPDIQRTLRISSFPKNGWSVRIFGEITPRISSCEGLESRNKIVSLYILCPEHFLNFPEDPWWSDANRTQIPEAQPLWWLHVVWRPQTRSAHSLWWTCNDQLADTSTIAAYSSKLQVGRLYLHPRKGTNKCSFEKFLLFERFFSTWA